MGVPETRFSILLHDYGRYPFTLSLASELSGRGYQLRYLYAAMNPTPPNRMGSHAGDSPGLTVEPVGAGLGLTKSNFLLRWFQERAYGIQLAQALNTDPPAVVISANTPLDVQRRLQRAALQAGTPFVHWLQDLIGPATTSILGSQLGPVGRRIGEYYQRMEARILRDSDTVIAISRAFHPFLEQAGVELERVAVIENWADPGAIQALPRENEWAREHGLDGGVNFLYTGTLGYKHDPDLFLHLASGLAEIEEARVIVISEGPRADALRRVANRTDTVSLEVIPYQAEASYAQVLATGDVLLAGLSEHASRYSVPSKVLTYLCAGRPILLSAGSDNPAATLIEHAGAGIVVAPDDRGALVEAARWLVQNPVERRVMGSRARALAEERFAIGSIGDRFEELLTRVVKVPGETVVTTGED